MREATGAAPSGGRIRRDRLDLELFRRGWTAADFARRVSPRTLRRLALALTAAPTIAGVDVLLGAEAPASTSQSTAEG